jgi:DNA replication protein DnaC
MVLTVQPCTATTNNLRATLQEFETMIRNRPDLSPEQLRAREADRRQEIDDALAYLVRQFGPRRTIPIQEPERMDSEHTAERHVNQAMETIRRQKFRGGILFRGLTGTGKSVALARLAGAIVREKPLLWPYVVPNGQQMIAQVGRGHLDEEDYNRLMSARVVTIDDLAPEQYVSEEAKAKGAELIHAIVDRADRRDALVILATSLADHSISGWLTGDTIRRIRESFVTYVFQETKCPIRE